MIFKRENIYSIIERQVKESLKEDSSVGRITKVELTPEEWRLFCKYYSKHSAIYSKKNTIIRFTIPQQITRVSRAGTEVHDCNPHIDYHEVLISCESAGSCYGF